MSSLVYTIWMTFPQSDDGTSLTLNLDTFWTTSWKYSLTVILKYNDTQKQYIQYVSEIIYYHHYRWENKKKQIVSANPHNITPPCISNVQIKRHRTHLTFDLRVEDCNIAYYAPLKSKWPHESRIQWNIDTSTNRFKIQHILCETVIMTRGHINITNAKCDDADLQWLETADLNNKLHFMSTVFNDGNVCF